MEKYISEIKELLSKIVDDIDNTVDELNKTDNGVEHGKLLSELINSINENTMQAMEAKL